MMHRTATAVLTTLAIFTMACAVPLGPGFHAERELLEVRFVSGAPPHLEVRATFTLKNSGNAPLDSLEISLPNEKNFGRSNLRITVDGAAVSPQPLADPAAAASAREPASVLQSSVQIVFASAWPQNARRTLVVAYDLSRTAERGTTLALSDTSFYLPDGAWYPLLRAPKSLFARGDAPPLRFDLSVIVPHDFLIHAAGQSNGKRRRAAESEFRFRITADDFSPFVVAGRYHQQQFKDSAGTVFFWTLQPLPPDHVQRIGPRLTATAQIFEKLFGPMRVKKRSYPLWIVETSFPVLQEVSGARLTQTSHAPAVALLSSSAFGDSVGSEEFLNLVARAWASTWSHHVVRPAPGTDELLGDALTEYAIMVAARARRGEPARLLFASKFLNSYDAACRENKEIPVAMLEQENRGMQQRIAEDKTALFLLAAENEVGAQTLHHALRRMIQGLHGRTYGFIDFRAALEAESGKNLGELFRTWLNQRGIPAGFRARYAEQKIGN